jgi:hypothetical protein
MRSRIPATSCQPAASLVGRTSAGAELGGGSELTSDPARHAASAAKLMAADTPLDRALLGKVALGNGRSWD